MALVALRAAALRGEYWADAGRARVIEQLRVTAPAVLALQLGFSLLDYWAFPESFPLFLGMRAGVNVLLLFIIFRGRFVWPNASKVALCLAVGGEILAMTYATGGPASNYYVGLIILFVGMPVLLPLTARESAAICSVYVIGFAASPLFMSVSDWRGCVIAVVFVVSGAFESVMSCLFLDRARVMEFAQRREVEKARDELAELDRAKSRFTANVHHELRTPLTLTLAPLEGMLAGDFGEVPERLRGYLKTMHVNALRLLKLINNLLDLAKIEGQQLALHRRNVDVARVAADIVAGARPLGERKRVELVTAFAEGVPAVNADPDALEKVIVNLVGNALKFTEGGRIEVRGEPHAEGLHLVVADTGIGIPPDQLGRIFDRFAQVDASATRKHEGTGIGLSLVKELVELHGGRVWAESQGLGYGTEMHVILPIGVADDEADQEVVQADGGRAVGLEQAFDAVAAELDLPSAGSESFRLADLERNVERWEGARTERPEPDRDADPSAAPPDAPDVVVAEDNADMRRLFGFLLGREFRVRLARNGREALELVRARPPDLVLTDVMMPEMSGTELCRALKTDPELRGIPVVIVTSKAEREMKIEGLELGADDYVTKPFHPRELLARVRAFVRLHRLQGELAERNTRLEAALAELKETEVQLVQAERLAAVGELAAGIAHEANNPVNFALNAVRALGGHVEAIRGVAEKAAALEFADPTRLRAQAGQIQKLRRELGFDQAAGEVEELIGIVEEGLERTRRLVGDLRDFAAPARRADGPVDLGAGLASTIQLFRRGLCRDDLRIETGLEEELPPLHGDAGALNQVFLNLLKNAADALGVGGGTIRVEVRREGASLVVDVRDDGPGVPDSVRERLFEPFVTTKKAGQGSGLGLSICRRIVEAHRGTIELVAAEPQGTVARLRFPVGGAGAT